jgi:hypothetical protein
VLTSQVVIETAARLGITPAQAALQWLLQLAPTGSVAHLPENLAAEGIALDDEALRQLGAVAPWPDDPSRALSGHDHRTGFRACTDRGRHRRRGRKRQDSVPSSSTATSTSSTICRPRRQPGCVAAVPERYGRCDVFVHCAAAFDQVTSTDVDAATWRHVQAVNTELAGLVQTFAAGMAERSFARRGGQGTIAPSVGGR